MTYTVQLNQATTLTENGNDYLISGRMSMETFTSAASVCAAPCRRNPPVGGNVAHEQDAGVHVEVEGGSTNGTVEQMEMGGGAGVVGDADWETQADKEVGGHQVLQVDGDTTGRKVTPAEVDPQCKAVEDQTDLKVGETGIITTTTVTRATTKAITRTITTTMMAIIWLLPWKGTTLSRLTRL